MENENFILEYNKRFGNEEHYPGDAIIGNVQFAGIRPKPKSPKRMAYDALVRNAPAIKDKVIVPLKNELVKGSKELKDSTNAYMHRATTPPEWLIKEAIEEYFRKTGE